MSTVLDPIRVDPSEMSPNANGRTYTPEELLEMPDLGRFELVDGRLVERNMGSESSQVGGRVFLRIGNYIEANSLGAVFPADCGYQIFPDRPKLVRFPDASFVRSGRLSNDVGPKGHMRIVPDLVLEVVSPNDLAGEVDAKIVEYQKVGVPLIWVAYPDSRSIYVYRQDRPFERLGPNQTLTGDEVLPGFAIPVADLFPTTAMQPEPVNEMQADRKQE